MSKAILALNVFFNESIYGVDGLSWGLPLFGLLQGQQPLLQEQIKSHRAQGFVLQEPAPRASMRWTSVIYLGLAVAVVLDQYHSGAQGDKGRTVGEDL